MKELLLRNVPLFAGIPPDELTALAKHFGTQSLEGFGFGEEDGPAIQAAGAVLDYLAETQKTSLGHVDRLLPYRRETRLEIDYATRRSLEICQTIRDGRRHSGCEL